MSARRHLVVAMAILAVGWGIGLRIYLAGADDQTLPFELTADSRQYMNQVERLGGKSAVIYQELLALVQAWTHGWRLGITVAAISSVLALAWLWFAPVKVRRAQP
jgi:hypothetical protein